MPFIHLSINHLLTNLTFFSYTLFPLVHLYIHIYIHAPSQIYLFFIIHLPVHPYIYLSIHRYFSPIHLPMNPSKHLHLFIYSPIHPVSIFYSSLISCTLLFTYPSNDSFICLPTNSTNFSFINSSIHTTSSHDYLPIYLFTHTLIYLLMHLSNNPFTYLPIHMSFIFCHLFTSHLFLHF